MIYVAASGRAEAGEPGGVNVIDPVTWRLLGRSEPIDELLYLALDPSGRILYGTSGVAIGYVHTWRIVGSTLVPVGPPVPSGGSEPCQIVVHPDGYLLVANYGSGEAGSIAALLIDENGAPEAPTVLVRDTAPGPDPDRQQESHIHQIVVGRDGEVLVVDLGADEVASFVFTYGGLVDPVVSRAPAGSGPRHLVLLPGGDIAVSGELSSTLLRARRADRKFVDWQVTDASGAALPEGTRNYPSDLRPGAHGEALFIANRGADSVAALSISTGAIMREGPCGASPRHLAVDGELIYVSATDSHQVDILQADTLLVAHPPIRVGRPMCVVVDHPGGVGNE